MLDDETKTVPASEGDAAEGDAAEAVPSGQGEVTTPSSEESKWYDVLPDEYKQDKTLQRYTSLEDFAKAHSELRKMASKMAKLPDKDAPPEEVEKFYQKLGKPETVDKYEVTFDNLPKHIPIDEKAVSEFKELAFKLNLTGEQAKLLNEWNSGRVVKAYDSQIRQVEKKMQDTIELLKDEWGDDYEKNIKSARSAMKKLLSPASIDYLDQTFLGNDINLIRDFVRMGKLVSEDAVVGIKSKAPQETASLAELNKKKVEIYRSKDYQRGDSSAHEMFNDIIRRIANLESKQQ